MKALNVLLVLLFVAFSQSLLASSVDTYQFSKPEYETRFHELNKILRCPKCQNQNLADSNSMISQDLRKEVFRLIEEGRSDDQIMEFMVMRYGDFVLYKPKLDNKTYFLWFGPAVFGVIGVMILLVVVIRQRGKRQLDTQDSELTEDKLSDSEQQALDKILSNNDR